MRCEVCQQEFEPKDSMGAGFDLCQAHYEELTAQGWWDLVERIEAATANTGEQQP